MQEPPIINHLLFKGQSNIGLLDPLPASKTQEQGAETIFKEPTSPQLSSQNQEENHNKIVISIRDFILAFVWFTTVLLFLVFLKK
jgi:hypothetical protein